MSNYAYVTFIIKNDSFLPGALNLAHSLRSQNTKNDIVCIVSEEVSDLAIEILEVLYTRVIKINSLVIKHSNIKGRQDRNKLFSRFNALLLTEYKKIVLLDADILAIKNSDSLFDLNSPAGIINESKENCIEYNDNKYIIPDTYCKDSKWIWHKIYEPISKHGELIPKNITDRVLSDNTNLGVNSGIYVLTPSVDLYNEIVDDIIKEATIKLINTFNWPEMQYFTQKMSGKWTNIDIKYGSFNGYPEIKALYGMHFSGLKPWNFKNKSIRVYSRFDDYQLWYHSFIKMCSNNKKLLSYKKINNYINIINDLIINNNFNKEYYTIFKNLI